MSTLPIKERSSEWVGHRSCGLDVSEPGFAGRSEGLESPHSVTTQTWNLVICKLLRILSLEGRQAALESFLHATTDPAPLSLLSSCPQDEASTHATVPRRQPLIPK